LGGGKGDEKLNTFFNTTGDAPVRRNVRIQVQDKKKISRPDEKIGGGSVVSKTGGAPNLSNSEICENHSTHNEKKSRRGKRKVKTSRISSMHGPTPAIAFPPAQKEDWAETSYQGRDFRRALAASPAKAAQRTSFEQ